MPDNILKIKNKRLKEEFWNHPMYSDRNDIEYYNKNKKDYENRPAFVQSGPAVAPGAPSIYGYAELDYPRIGFYTLIPGNNPNPKHEYLEEYVGKPALYRWTKGDGFFNSKHYPEVTRPGEANYPRIVQEFVTLSNMAGHPSYVGLSPELSKLLPELVIMPNQKYFIVRLQNGGTMKKLVQKYQQGNSIDPFVRTSIPLHRSLRDLIDGFHPSMDVYKPQSYGDYKGDDGWHGHTDINFIDWSLHGENWQGVMSKSYVRDNNGNITYGPTYFPGSYWIDYSKGKWHKGPGELAEEKATKNYIKQNKGNLPWWYEGSPENPHELEDLIVTTKGTPFTRAYDWYNSGYKYPYTITENVGFDRNGNDSIMSSFMINPLGDSLYNIGQFPEILSPRGESIFNNRLIQKNNTKEAKQKFIKDYKRSKKL